MLVNSNNKILVRNRNLFSGLKFNGTSQYTSTNPLGTALEFSSPADDKTISFWIIIHPGTGNRSIFSAGGTTSGYLFAATVRPSNSMYFFLRSRDSQQNNIELNNAPLPFNKLAHVVCVKVGLDSSQSKIYVNGIQAPTRINNNNLTSDSDVIGMNYYNIGSNMDCIISDFKVFNAALSSIDIKQLYRAEGKLPKKLTPVLNLDFNQLNGHVVPDRSGNGYDFDLVNYTDTEVGIPDQSTNTAWVNAYPPYNPFV